MNHETLATVGLVVAATALGFVFGVEATGRLATVWLYQEVELLPSVITNAAWIQRAHLLRNAAVGVFGVAAVGSTAVWVRGEDGA